MSLRVGIDIGGTFTDFALLRDGGVVLEKTLSTPDDPSRAVMTGLEQLAAREGVRCATSSRASTRSSTPPRSATTR